MEDSIITAKIEALTIAKEQLEEHFNKATQSINKQIHDIRLECPHNKTKRVSCPAGGKADVYCDICGMDITYIDHPSYGWRNKDFKKGK